MRASTLFGLTIAILIGLAVVFGVKTAGLFDKTPPKVVDPDRPKILVAVKNLFEGHAAMSDDVMVRQVEPGEMNSYIPNKNKYMPAYPMAANLRVLARNVTAGEPLLREHFQDHIIPGSFDVVLGPGMRAVNVEIPKDRSAGGMIRKGDRVDVHLTTTISMDPAGLQSSTMTAPIATGLKVVFKRNSLFVTMQPVDDKPIPFTLEANPYRAALIEFSKTRGLLTLIPTGPDANLGKTKIATADEFDKDEQQRVVRFSQDRMPITNKDLEEIFKLGPIKTGRPLEEIQHFSGIMPKRSHIWQPAGELPSPGGYSFNSPGGSSLPAGYVPCSTCPGGMKKAG